MALRSARVTATPRSTCRLPSLTRGGPDEPGALTVLPAEADGWSGTPGLAGHQGGADTVVRWSDVRTRVSDIGDPGGGGRLTIAAVHPVNKLETSLVPTGLQERRRSSDSPLRTTSRRPEIKLCVVALAIEVVA